MWLVLAGLALVLIAVLTSLGSHLEVFGTELGGGVRLVGRGLRPSYSTPGSWP